MGIFSKIEYERRNGVDDMLRCLAVPPRTIMASTENEGSDNVGSDDHECQA